MKLKLEDFDYKLPNELIASQPCAVRSHCKLLRLGRTSSSISHHFFYELINFVKEGDLLVMNDTKVLRARIMGKKATGGSIELMLERILPAKMVLALIKASKPPSIGSTIYLGASLQPFTVVDKVDELYKLQTTHEYDALMEFIASEGSVPLPPYMQRDSTVSDDANYQTVYAKNIGSVAAPTAGLHFDEPLLHDLEQSGVHLDWITLHVGAGTYKPVRDLKSHIMHSELANVSPKLVDKIKAVKAKGGRVIAVGTTTVRALEAAAENGSLAPFCDDTRLFIQPGFKFKVIDAMITNFHVPKSTLLMLVSAFASRELILDAYHSAISERYRFFSYGDAMLID